MKIKIVFFAFIFILPNMLSGQVLERTVSISETDFLELKVCIYLHSFKEFDTSIIVLDKQISIGIYYDISTQDPERAKQLKQRLELQIPHRISKYEWAKAYTLLVTVWGEDTANRGY